MKLLTTARLRLNTSTLAAVALLAATPVWALLPAVHTGMFGVARGQTVQINFSHLGDRTTDPVQFDVQFVDMLGNVVAHDAKIVGPGQAGFFNVAFSAFGTDAKRAEIRAIISAHNPPSDGTAHNPPSGNSLRTSVEVFDTDTGKTTFILHNPPADKS